MPIEGQIKGSQVIADLWIPVHEVESSALDQIRNVASLEPVKKVSIMSDVHTGKGICIGSVIGMKDAVAPSFVGVDIGCGMVAVKTNLHKSNISKKQLEVIYNEIKSRIPVGFNSRNETHYLARDSEVMNNFCKLNAELEPDMESKAAQQLGTLGGGNHFIELEYDLNNQIWLMLHSGSRNVGYKIADYYIKKAKDLSKNAHLKDRALSYFTSQDEGYEQYLHDMTWAQQYAALNRDIMMYEFIETMGNIFDVKDEETIQCHHNFAQKEVYDKEELVVIRKGAIQAKRGQMGIIPGSMGRMSYITRGLGNPISMFSAPHGAGRRMSRSKAKQKYNKSDLEKTMSGILCRTDKGVVDEICYSYKSIEEVINRASDLVEPVAELQQLMCIKG